MSSWHERSTCSLCGSRKLELCLELPATPLANEFLKPGAAEQEKFPLALAMCQRCRHVQTSVIVDPARLFGSYVYETATSPTTVRHLRSQAEHILSRWRWQLERSGHPRILEVGSNDGTLLLQFRKLGVPKENLLGIEPAPHIAARADEAGAPTLCTFFPSVSISTLAPLRERSFDIVVANNVFAHVPDVLDSLRTVRSLLHPDGIFVMEFAHAADSMGQAFDTIYHEHMSYHALGPLKTALESIDLPVFDVEVQAKQVGRGSMRIWAGHQVDSDGQYAIRRTLHTERLIGTSDPLVWRKTEATIAATKDRLNDRLSSVNGHLAGYGAPAKMTTLAYACELDTTRFVAVADDAASKQGLLTPGTKIPVVSREELLRANPALVVTFAWNFAEDIAIGLRSRGYAGPIYTPLPLPGKDLLPLPIPERI